MDFTIVDPIESLSPVQRQAVWKFVGGMTDDVEDTIAKFTSGKFYTDDGEPTLANHYGFLTVMAQNFPSTQERLIKILTALRYVPRMKYGRDVLADCYQSRFIEKKKLGALDNWFPDFEFDFGEEVSGGPSNTTKEGSKDWINLNTFAARTIAAQICDLAGIGEMRLDNTLWNPIGTINNPFDINLKLSVAAPFMIYAASAFSEFRDGLYGTPTDSLDCYVQRWRAWKQVFSKAASNPNVTPEAQSASRLAAAEMKKLDKLPKLERLKKYARSARNRERILRNYGESSPRSSLNPTSKDDMRSYKALAFLKGLKAKMDGLSYLQARPAQTVTSRRLEDVVLSCGRIQHLLQHFFEVYHPYLPLLDPEKSSEDYYDASPLLFWTIIAVAARRFPGESALAVSISGPVNRLLWTTLADVPQSYHVVQALCLLCTWKLPLSTTSSDPTLLLSGLMMHLALLIGLHRPCHSHDLSISKVQPSNEEQNDRTKTWSACKFTAHWVATSYGQPHLLLYDWNLNSSGPSGPSSKQPPEVERILEISLFCDKVNKCLFPNQSDPTALLDDSTRSVFAALLVREFEDIKENLGLEISIIEKLYLCAAQLHLRLSAFFDSPTSKDYYMNLIALWRSANSFLECEFSHQSTGRFAISGYFVYAPNYIQQMIIAATFTLLRLCTSFFADRVNCEYGRKQLTHTIWTIQTMGVTKNDLYNRLAEVLAQLSRRKDTTTGGSENAVNTSLHLKVKCRMSMSVVYDSVWR